MNSDASSVETGTLSVMPPKSSNPAPSRLRSRTFPVLLRNGLTRSAALTSAWENASSIVSSPFVKSRISRRRTRCWHTQGVVARAADQHAAVGQCHEPVVADVAVQVIGRVAATPQRVVTGAALKAVDAPVAGGVQIVVAPPTR